MTLNKAFQQTLRKWEVEIDNLVNETDNETSGCGLCIYRNLNLLKRKPPYETGCPDCILVKYGDSCNHEDSPYVEWQAAIFPGDVLQAAQNMYTFLLLTGHAEGLL